MLDCLCEIDSHASDYFPQLGYLVGYLAIGAIGGWRIMYAIAGPIALILAMGMWWMPPSPRWILLCACKGNSVMDKSQERAAAAIRRLRGSGVDEEVIAHQMQETLQSLQLVHDEASLAELFTGTSLKALIIGCGLVLFQQVKLLAHTLSYNSWWICNKISNVVNLWFRLPVNPVFFTMLRQSSRCSTFLFR